MAYSSGISNISYAQVIAKMHTCRRTVDDIHDKTISSRMAKVYKQDICYDIQQMCEIMMKIQFVEAGVQITNYKYFRHDLSDIYQYAQTFTGLNLYVPDEIKNAFMKITSWEVHGRYDYGMTVRLDTIEKFLNVIDEWISVQTKNKSIYNTYNY